MEVLGFDIGGSGIKGAVIDILNGEMKSERLRYPTPEFGKPEAVVDVFNQIIRKLDYKGPVGYGFPVLTKNGVVLYAANIDDAWEGIEIGRFIEDGTGLPAYVLNDADAAGLAEMRFGVGKDQQEGVVMLLTLGTGIGSAIFVDGILFPNTELGHLKIRGKDAEKRASDAARKKKELTWEKWAERFQEYLDELELLFSPDVFILGGGLSKKTDSYLHLLQTRAKIIPASLKNDAGIIGASVFAYEMSSKRKTKQVESSDQTVE